MGVDKRRDPNELWKLFIDVCREENLPPDEALQGLLAAAVIVCKCPPAGQQAIVYPRWVKIAKAAWRTVQVNTKPTEANGGDGTADRPE